MCMTKRSSAMCATLAILVLAGAGCSKSATAPDQAKTVPAATQQENAKAAPQPGQIAYDFPVQAATTAKAGEYVLAVPRTWVDQSFENPTGATFIYYAAKMVTPGTNESQVESLPGETMTIPNALIIPLGSGAKANKGDIVLTWWQSGSGMNRAIVVGGTPTEPEVLYLDQEYNTADTAEKLMPNSFVKLTAADQAGATIACKTSGETDFTRYQLVNSSSDRVLLLGWAGKMAAMKKSDCANVPLTPSAKAGDSVYFPSYGRFTLGTVTKVDSAIGRVTVKYQFAGQDEEVMVPFGDVTSQFVR